MSSEKLQSILLGGSRFCLIFQLLIKVSCPKTNFWLILLFTVCTLHTKIRFAFINPAGQNISKSSNLSSFKFDCNKKPNRKQCAFCPVPPRSAGSLKLQNWLNKPWAPSILIENKISCFSTKYLTFLLFERSLEDNWICESRCRNSIKE